MQLNRIKVVIVTLLTKVKTLPMSSKPVVTALRIIKNQRINNYIQTTILDLLLHRAIDRIRIINQTKSQITTSSPGSSSNQPQLLLSLSQAAMLSSKITLLFHPICNLLMLLCLRCFCHPISIRCPKWTR